MVSSLRGQGVQILSRCEPQSIEKGSNGRLDVIWRDEAASQICRDQFDTVLFATGEASREREMGTLIIHVGVQGCAHIGRWWLHGTNHL